MSGGSEFPLSLIVKAVDRATGPLAAITQKLEHFTKPLAKAVKTLSEFGEVSGLMKVGEAFKGVGEGVHKVGEKAFELVKELALLGLEAGFVAFEFIKHFVEIGDELKKTSDRLGMTVDGYASLQFAARKAGVSHEELTGALDKFNKELGLAHHNSGKLYGFLAVASPVLLKQVKGAKSSEEALDLMWKAMVKLKNPADRAAFATAVFGKSAGKMVGLVRDGVGGLEEQRAEFLRLAGSQKDFADSSEKLDDLMVDVSAAFSGVGASIATELFPAVTELAKALREFLVENRTGIATWAKETGAAITGWVKSGGIQRLIQGFRDFAAKVQPIVDMLGGWPKVLLGIGAAILAGPLLGALAGLAASFVTLGMAILTTPVGWFLLACAAIAGAAALVISNWEPISAFFKEFFPGFSADVANAVEGLKLMIGWLVEAVKVYRQWEARRGDMAEINGEKRPQTLAAAGLQGLWRATPLGQAQVALSGAADLFGSRPSTGAGTASYRAMTEPNKLVVDFNNAPKGTRVTQESGGDLDLKMGYANSP